MFMNYGSIFWESTIKGLGNTLLSQTGRSETESRAPLVQAPIYRLNQKWNAFEGTCELAVFWVWKRLILDINHNLECDMRTISVPRPDWV